MSADNPVFTRTIYRHRRRRRLERELTALQAMSSKLWLVEFSWAFVAVPFIAVISTVTMRAHGLSGAGFAVVLTIALATCGTLWWLSHHWRMPVRLLIWVAWLSLCLLAKEYADPPIETLFDEPSRKAPRRAKLRRAIDKRIALLRAMGVTPRQT